MVAVRGEFEEDDDPSLCGNGEFRDSVLACLWVDDAASEDG